MHYQYDIAECERILLVKGLQQSDVAEKSGVSKMSVSNFFRGIPVRNKIAIKIIKAIGADPEKIVRLVEADEPECPVGSFVPTPEPKTSFAARDALKGIAKSKDLVGAGKRRRS